MKYYEKNGEQVSGEVVNGQLITTMTVGGVVVSNPLITDIEADGWVEYIPSTPGDVQISAADWTALITAVNQLTGSELVYSDTAQDVTDEITALRNGVTFANVAKWWSLPLLLANGSFITSINSSEIQTIESYAFYGDTVLTSVNLPNCTSVGAYGFNGCSALTNVNLPNCTNVGTYGFNGCSALTNVNLPNCTNVGTYGFNGCSALTSVNLPNCTSVGTYGFSSCGQLKIIRLPQCTSIYPQIFRWTDALEWIDCKNLTTANDWNFDKKIYLQRLDVKTTNLGDSGTFSYPKLYCFVIHKNIDTSINFTSGSINWNPTEGFNTGSNSLVSQQEWDLDENGDPIDCSQFTTNADKALWCFKHLFMPAFGTVTSATLTLKSTVYDVVMNDNEVSTYFSTRGWTVARVA